MMSKKMVLTTMQELCARSGYAHTVLLTSFRRNGQTVETPMHVSIRIQGHLDPSWQEWLEIGGATLVEMLHEQDFIGEYRLTVFPIVLASGKHLLREGSAYRALHLVECRSFLSGLLVLTYQLARK